MYIGSGAAGGAALGALLGAAGSAAPRDARVVIGLLAALAAAAVAILELAGWGPRIVQRNRETPQRWLHSGALRWAARNGLALGTGLTTRLGFWLWYVVPAAALLVGDPVFGAAVFGIYGAFRTGGVLLIMLLTRALSGDLAFATDRLRAWHPVVRRGTSLALLLVAALAVAHLG